MTETIRIEINGTWHELEVERRTTLLEVLRDRLHLTGTKNGCGQRHSLKSTSGHGPGYRGTRILPQKRNSPPGG